jgi:hypothetical protein
MLRLLARSARGAAQRACAVRPAKAISWHRFVQTGAAAAKPRALAWLKEVSETIPLRKDRKEVGAPSQPPRFALVWLPSNHVTYE